MGMQDANPMCAFLGWNRKHGSRYPEGKILPARRTMPIEDPIISVFVGVDDTLNSGSGMS